MDLFDYRAPSYPRSPGFLDRDTSRKAAVYVAERVNALRGRSFAVVSAAGSYGRTADEVADILDETVLSIRPRFTELLRLGKIRDSGQRRKNESGRSAKVWIAA